MPNLRIAVAHRPSLQLTLNDGMILPNSVWLALNSSRPDQYDAIDSLKKRLCRVFFVKTVCWGIFRGVKHQLENALDIRFDA